MNKMLFAALVLCSSFAYADDVTVLEDRIYVRDPMHSQVETKIQMDTKTGEGYVKVEVLEDAISPYSNNYRIPVSVYRKTVKVDALVLIDNKIVYQAVEGDVECGTLGISRVLRRPTISLSGNCDISGSVIRGIADTKVVVKIKTN